MHPIFITTLRRPDLVIRHLSNYGEMVKAELAAVGRSFALRAAAAAVALVTLLLALGLSGIAVMLGFLQAYHWVLLVVPGVAWALSAISILYALRPSVQAHVDGVKDEIEADVRMFRLIKEANDGRVFHTR